MKNHHFSPALHQSTAPFSHFVRDGDTGYVSGMIGQRPEDGALVSDDIAEQCTAMLRNIETLLAELGLTLANLLRTTIYLTDYKDFNVINDVYAAAMKAPYPARTTLQVAGLPLGAKVQIDAVVTMKEHGRVS